MQAGYTNRPRAGGAPYGFGGGCRIGRCASGGEPASALGASGGKAASAGAATAALALGRPLPDHLADVGLVPAALTADRLSVG